MKGLFFKCFIAIFLAAGITNYLIYIKTGNMPLVDWKNKVAGLGMSAPLGSFSPKESLSDAKQSIEQLIPGSMSSSSEPPVKVYKWKDSKGVVHYENRPVDGAKEMLVDVNSNILKQEGRAVEVKSTVDRNQDASESNPDELSPIAKARATSEFMKAHSGAVDQSAQH